MPPSSLRCITVSKKGRAPFYSSSMVNLIVGRRLSRWSRNSFTCLPSITQEVSSTYLFHIWGCSVLFSKPILQPSPLQNMHAWTHKHQPAWAETRILDQARNTSILRIKEAIHISSKNQGELMNRDQGVEIDGWWKCFFRDWRQ